MRRQAPQVWILRGALLVLVTLALALDVLH
jgi:hypothetical protein